MFERRKRHAIPDTKLKLTFANLIITNLQQVYKKRQKQNTMDYKTQQLHQKHFQLQIDDLALVKQLPKNKFYTSTSNQVLNCDGVALEIYLDSYAGD